MISHKNISAHKYSAYLKSFIKSTLTLVIIFYILTLLDFNILWQGLQKMSISALLVTSLFCFLSSLSQAARWCYMTKDQLSSSYLKQMLLFWKASFFNLITPASLGGDVYRVIASNKTQQGGTAFGLIIRERLLGLFGIFSCYLLFLILLKFNRSALPSLFLTLGVFSILGIIMLILLQSSLPLFARISSRYLSPVWQTKITAISNATRFQSYRELMILIIFTLFSIINWALVFYVLARTLNHSVIRLEELGLVSIITEIIRWIPVTIQGLGLREGAAVYAFNILGYSFEIGFLVSGLAYLINTLVLLIIGIIGFLSSSWLSYKEVDTSSYQEVK